MFDFRRSLSYVSSCSESEPKYAVDLQNIVFGFKQNTKIINKLTLKIAEGKICAILGSNGSGKTTLLKLILGRLRPRVGTIRIFDKRPSTETWDLEPGVGYMPQHNGLLSELTIEETLKYYCLIYRTNITETELRIREFTERWNMVQKDRLVGQLDRDQKKILSFGISIIHRPRLLILDEPTVGVDSEIRHRIWDKLERMCKESGTTILVTTYNVEEARNAHTVGFVYSGKCLKFGSPDELQKLYRCETLEGLYFMLVKDFITASKESFKYVLEEEENKFIRIQDILSKRDSEEKLNRSQNPSFDSQRIRALMWRNALSVKRKPKVFCFYTLMPIIMICLINLCFGRPKNIPIGIYNAEEMPVLSKTFVDRIDNQMFHKTIFKSNESSYESVVSGQNYFSIVFDQNFTENLYHRLLEPNIMTEKDLNNTGIKLYVDSSNPVIAHFTQIHLIQTFHKLISIFWHLIGRNPAILSLPFEFHGLNGELEGSYDFYLCPGLVLAAIQFLNILITTYYAFNLVNNKKGILVERCLVAGVTSLDMLLAQSLLVTLFILTQAMVVTIMMYSLYEYPINGNIMDVLLLFVLQGIQGMTFGTTIALIFKDFISSAYAIGFTVITLWLTSGMLWPLESTPSYLQTIGESTSLGASILSLRYIMFRGWTLFNSFRVASGYLKLIAHIIIFSAINLFLAKNI